MRSRLSRTAKESDCKITDGGPHMKCGVIRNDSEDQKDTVTLDEEKGEVPVVEVRDKIEHVAAILKNPCRSEVYRRNTRAMIRMVSSAKYTMPAMVKLAKEIVAAPSDVIGYSMVFHPMTSSRDILWRESFSFLSWSADHGMQVVNVSCREKAGYMMRTVHLLPTNKVTIDNGRGNAAAQEFILPIREGWSKRHRKGA